MIPIKHFYKVNTAENGKYGSRFEPTFIFAIAGETLKKSSGNSPL